MPLVQKRGQMGQKSGREVLINGKKIIVAQKILGSFPGPKQCPKQLSSQKPFVLMVKRDLFLKMSHF